MIPFNHFSKAMNMKGIGDIDVDSKYYQIKEKIGKYIPYRVSFWWRDHDIFHPVRIYYNILHIASWVPLLWNDFDWDYNYLYKIMEKKLSMMKEHHRDTKTIGDWKKVSDEIEVAEKALSRLIKDDYCAAEHSAHNKKFKPFKRWRSRKQNKDGMFEVPKPSAAEWKDSKRLYELEDQRWKADMDLFCKTFKECSRGWWS